jgi:hypothetical protein
MSTAGGQYLQYMERERETLETKHKLKLKEFDMFLSQIHSKQTH